MNSWFVLGLTMWMLVGLTSCVTEPSGADAAGAREYHVAVTGDDAADGSAARPFRTIQRAAEEAQPGDTITVQAGVYRERIDPPRGGLSDDQRITYQAAPGAEVVIKGSEPVSGWEHVEHDTWELTLPESFFGDFNPFGDRIRGDWFNGQGRAHHTGAVYLDGHWLVEAASRGPVLAPAGDQALWFARLNNGPRVDAADFAEQHGMAISGAEGEEGSGTCLGWIEDGDWARYDGVEFGGGAEMIKVRTSSGTGGGVIEVRLDAPDGELLGSVTVPGTGGWNAWSTHEVAIAPTAGTRSVVTVFRAPEGSTDQYLMNLAWFRPQETDAEPVERTTTIWAQFKGIDPNEADVEINVRQAVFYPSEPGRNYITVSGFRMMHAAPNWAPPTAEQVGLIGTHWSKGWIIEDNEISYSTCTGITLGKYGDEFDNTSADTAEGYVKTIERAHAFHIPWTREHVGHHVVRRNLIEHCEQAGLVGSMGGAFSVIEDNVIRDINIRGMLAGAELAGIKLHAPIDTVIRRNHIHRVPAFGGGIWLDWMTQGSRVTGNLLHDNSKDLFLEVNHGPYLIDHNILLSGLSIWDWSQGGAFVHNLIGGNVGILVDSSRLTPFHERHSTAVKGLANIRGGDNRFYNNLFLRVGLNNYNNAHYPVAAGGNVYLGGAQPLADEEPFLAVEGFDGGARLEEVDGRMVLHFNLPDGYRDLATDWVTTELLGRSKIAGELFLNYDGTELKLDTDYFGATRETERPAAGPFSGLESGAQRIAVFPRAE